MNKPLVVALAITAIIGASPLSRHAQAGNTGLQRCQTADGVTVYTDRACAALGARTAPLPSQLLTTIARDEARAEERLLEANMATDVASMEADTTAPSSTIDYAEYGGFADAETPLATTTAAVGRRSASGGCARSPTQLAMDLRGAFALGDVNRIAESYHWAGMSHKGALRIMERLENLARHHIADTQYFNAQISSGGIDGWSASSTSSSVGGSAGVLQVTFGDDGRTLSVTDFDVEHYAGCYFVRF